MNLIESLQLRPLFRRALPRAIGLACYALAGVVTPYLLFFAGARLVPWTVDSGSPSGLAGSLAVDALLVLLFGAQHSLLARPVVKERVARLFSADLERSAYVLATSLVLLALFALWRPLPAVVWHLEAARAPAAALFALGVIVVYASAFSLGHFRLLGLAQAWFGAPAVESESDRFQAGGVYRYVRHPLMTGLLFVFWSTHHMTAGHLFLAAAMTAYIFIGTRCEERDLSRRFGAEYLAWRARTPAFFPALPWPRRPRQSASP
jgi:protein-S-isoprenylcysteine O-methyltransferase Ste14